MNDDHDQLMDIPRRLPYYVNENSAHPPESQQRTFIQSPGISFLLIMDIRPHVQKQKIIHGVDNVLRILIFHGKSSVMCSARGNIGYGLVF